MARVKAKKRKAAKECVQKKKADKIRPVLYIRKGFQNRAFWDFWSLPLGLLASKCWPIGLKMRPQILEGPILKPFSYTK
jgi:hypothetical protein